MDPQHRLLLEHAAEALQSCCLAASESTAVMVGICNGDFTTATAALPLSNYTASGASTSVAAGRWVADAFQDTKRSEHLDSSSVGG
jgi:acyl transferase domain-containing protein